VLTPTKRIRHKEDDMKTIFFLDITDLLPIKKEDHDVDEVAFLLTLPPFPYGLRLEHRQF
jgi:hypothetical protein